MFRGLRRWLLGWLGAIALFAAPGLAQAATPMATQLSSETMTVYRSPTCGCCEDWVERMEAAGFSIDDHVVEDVESIKAASGLPEPLASCHTAFIDGYLLEGHVAAAEVRRLLAEHPPVVGLAVPGMPVGSPGMEMEGEMDAYDTVIFDGLGHMAIFESHGG